MQTAAPGVHIERIDAARNPAVVLRTDIAAFVGLARRGPLDTPVPVESWRQFQAHFGDPFGGAYLGYAVRGFFDNGGARCWVVRVAARAFGTLGPSGAEPAGLLVWDRDGPPAWRIAASSPGTWGNGLAVLVERERPLTQPALRSDPLGCTLAAVAGFAAGELVELVQPDRRAGRVLVQVDPQAGRLAWVHPDPRRRGAEQIPWAALDPSLPLSVSRVAYGLTVWQDGAFLVRYADLHPARAHPRFVGLVLAPPYPDPGAQLRSAPPLDDGRLPPPPAPVQVQVLAADPAILGPQPKPVPLAGGVDGLAALRADDFLGRPWSPNDSDLVRIQAARGLQSLAAIDEVSLVAIPDCLIVPDPDPDYLPPEVPPTNPCSACPAPQPPILAHQPRTAGELPPRLAEAEILRVQTALIADCEARGDRFAVLSPTQARALDPSRGARAVAEWRALLTQDQPARAGALYAPWVAVAEDPGVPPPVPGSSAGVRLIPACGHVVGAMARTDLRIGVMRAPANIALLGLVDVRPRLTDAQHGELNDAGVDALRNQPGLGSMIQGARTLSDDPSFRYVNTVRMLIALRRAFELALRWSVFEPNDAPTRNQVASTLIAILTLFWQRGAFAGGTQAESFYVRCDEVSTDAAARDRGELIALVGVAPAAPAEFIVLRVGRQDDLPKVTLFQGQGATP